MKYRIFWKFYKNNWSLRKNKQLKQKANKICWYNFLKITSQKIANQNDKNKRHPIIKKQNLSYHHSTKSKYFPHPIKSYNMSTIQKKTKPSSTCANAQNNTFLTLSKPKIVPTPPSNQLISKSLVRTKRSGDCQMTEFCLNKYLR